jgi:hypothetical protein
MNPYGGKVVITNSKIENIDSCGALIRNKFSLLAKTFTPASGYDDFYTYYLMRSYKMTYDVYSNWYSGVTSPYTGCTETSPCSSIQISSTTFSSINT